MIVYMNVRLILKLLLSIPECSSFQCYLKIIITTLSPKSI